MRGEGMAWPETAPTVKTLYVNPAVDRTWRLPKYRSALVRPDHNFIPCRGKAASMIYYQWNADMHASGGIIFFLNRNRGIAKENLRDLSGACKDWSEAALNGIAEAKQHKETDCN